MSKIFGGSRQSSTSNNRAFDDIQGAVSPVLGGTADAYGQIAALLGGDASGFNAFKDATGFDALAEQGSRGITNNAAASGLLRSGGSGQALQAFGNNIQNQFANNYMERLMGQAQTGLQAGGLLASAGQQSTSRSRSKPGIGGLIGGVASGFAGG